MRRIALDLDGVFADWHGFVQSELGVPYSHTLWDKLDKIPQIFRRLEVLPASFAMFEQIWKLRNRGFEVFVLTAIPYPTCELLTADEDKRWWVAKHLSPEIPVHTVIGGENKKFWVNNMQDILIDDMQRNIDAWTSRGGRGILHTEVWNTLDKVQFNCIPGTTVVS